MTTMQVIDPRELNDLAEFAARGGLGSTVASVIPSPPSYASSSNIWALGRSGLSNKLRSMIREQRKGARVRARADSQDA